MIPERDVLDVVRLLRPDSFLRRYIAHFGSVSDAPYAWHLGTGLGVLSALAPIELTADFIGTVRANFWVMLVGDSYETRKTYSIGVGEGVIREKARRCFGGAPGSPEGLYDLMMNHPKALVTYPEFGDFLARSASGKYLADLRKTMTEAFDGRLNGRVLAPDKTGKRKALPNLEDIRLSIIAGTAHGFLEENTDYVDWSSGFLNRWCIFEAKRERSYPITEPRTDTAVRKAAALLAEVETRVDRDVGRFAGLTSDAKDRWIMWAQAREAERQAAGADAELNAATARTPVTAAKIALLLAYDYGIPCTGSATWRLPIDVLEPARRIAELHERSVRSLLKGISRNDAEREQRAVLRVVEAGPCTKATLLQRVSPKQNLRVLNGVIDTLIEAKAIYAHAVPSGATVYSTTAPDTTEADEMEIDFN